MLLVVCHFNTNPMAEYTVGAPYPGIWKEILNSDAKQFGGNGIVNGPLKAKKHPSHGHDYSVTFKLPPLSVMVFVGETPPPPIEKSPKSKSAKSSVQSPKSK